MKPSIHYLYRLSFTGSQECWRRSQLALGQAAGYTLDRSPVSYRADIDRQLILTFTPTGNLESPINLHVFGLCEEAGENSHRHEENMQTPHRGPLTVR